MAQRESQKQKPGQELSRKAGVEIPKKREISLFRDKNPSSPRRTESSARHAESQPSLSLQNEKTS